MSPWVIVSDFGVSYRIFRACELVIWSPLLLLFVPHSSFGPFASSFSCSVLQVWNLTELDPFTGQNSDRIGIWNSRYELDSLTEETVVSLKHQHQPGLKLAPYMAKFNRSLRYAFKNNLPKFSPNSGSPPQATLSGTPHSKKIGSDLVKIWGTLEHFKGYF